MGVDASMKPGRYGMSSLRLSSTVVLEPSPARVVGETRDTGATTATDQGSAVSQLTHGGRVGRREDPTPRVASLYHFGEEGIE